MVILNTPANPTGRVWPADELRKLADGLAARPGPPVYVLSDEVYRELYYTPGRPASMADVYGHALVAGSLSKSNALTGLRLGWLVGPGEVIAEATQVHQLVNTAASTFSGPRGAGDLPPPRIARRAPAALRRAARVAAGRARAARHRACAGGGRLLLLRPPSRALGAPIRSRAAERLLDEQRVVTVPGVAFGAAGEGWLRLSWVAPADALADGIARIARFFAD